MHVVVRLPTLALSAYFLISPLRGQPAGERPSKSSSGAPTFLDIAASSGVDFKNEPSPTSQKYLPESMVGGVAMLDYNGDDLLDLYFVNGAGLEDPMPPEKSPDKSEPRYWNRLYRNNGDGTFSDTTESAGVPVNPTARVLRSATTTMMAGRTCTSPTSGRITSITTKATAPFAR